MTIAMILAGGRGTRLRPVVSDVPKSLAPIQGKPFIFYLLDYLHAQNIREVILLTGYMHEKIVAACGDGSSFGLKMSYSQEHEPLGTAGAIKNAEKFLQHESEFLILNGDSYAPAAIKALVDHKLLPHQLGLIAVSKMQDASRFGTVIFDATDKTIRAFQEKSSEMSAGYVNAGVYRLSQKILQAIPVGKSVSLEREIFPKIVGRLGVVESPEGFDDIGLPENYREFTAKVAHEN